MRDRCRGGAGALPGKVEMGGGAHMKPSAPTQTRQVRRKIVLAYDSHSEPSAPNTMDDHINL